MSWATLFLVAGILFLIAWAYHSAKQAKENDPLEENIAMIVREQSAFDEKMSNVNPPDVFDEARIKSDLARLASTPGAVGKYIAQAQVRFKQARQIQVLKSWTAFYNAGEAVIRARTQLARAHSELRHVDIEGDVTLKEKDARIAEYEAQIAESKLRATEAEKKIADLKKEPSAPEKTLTPEQERILKKAEIEGRLTRLRAEKAQALSRIDPNDEDAKMRVENMYDDRIAREEEQLSRCL